MFMLNILNSKCGFLARRIFEILGMYFRTAIMEFCHSELCENSNETLAQLRMFLCDVNIPLINVRSLPHALTKKHKIQ